MLKKIIITLITLALSYLIAIQYNPNVLNLFLEGYPASVWQGYGHAYKVEGAKRLSIIAEKPTPLKTKWMRELFDKGQGKAIAFYRGGRLVSEHYVDGYGPDTRFNSFSLVKSLVGVLVYKAVGEGRIKTLDDPIGDYIKVPLDASLQTVTVRSLLDMTAGIVFEPHDIKSVSGEKDLEVSIFNPFGPMARLHFNGLDFILPQLKSSQSGVFSYQNVNTALLGLLLEQVYQKPLHHILSEKIWQPAGAQDALWRRYDKSQGVSAYCCLYARVNDWVLVAKFLMNNGTPDNPFLPDALWQELFGHSLKAEELVKGVYGNHMRYNILDREGQALLGRFTYFLGQGGQVVYIMPEKQLVVVRFGDRHQLLHSTLYAAWDEIK